MHNCVTNCAVVKIKARCKRAFNMHISKHTTVDLLFPGHPLIL